MANQRGRDAGTGQFKPVKEAQKDRQVFERIKPARSPAPPVLRLVEYSNRETVAILNALAARAARGEVVGVALCFKSGEGVEQCVFTGPYNKPAVAVNAAARMSWEMVRLQAEAGGVEQ